MLKYALRDGGKIYLFRLILFVIELKFYEIFFQLSNQKITWETVCVKTKPTKLWFKGQIISEAFFLFSILPKNERRTSALVARANFCQYFFRFFGRIEAKKDCFWNYLTFSTFLATVCKLHCIVQTVGVGFSLIVSSIAIDVIVMGLRVLYEKSVTVLCHLMIL